MTNSDWIKSMADEELVTVIMCPREIEELWGRPGFVCLHVECVECCKSWLKQPVKEDAE